jgi:hypothetical protein
MSAVQPKDVLVVGERIFWSCGGSVEFDDTNFVHTIKVLSVCPSNVSNHTESVF